MKENWWKLGPANLMVSRLRGRGDARLVGGTATRDGGQEQVRSFVPGGRDSLSLRNRMRSQLLLLKEGSKFTEGLIDEYR